MNNNRKRGKTKKDFSVRFFVIISLAAFFLFAGLCLVAKVKTFSPERKAEPPRLYLKENEESNLLITKASTLKNRLAGPIISENDPGFGPLDAPLTLVEFSDFACSFCREQEKILKELKDIYGDKMILIWKDYPENDQNSVSYKAALAGRCAEEQGKFWEFHDLLYAENGELNEEKFLSFAKKLGLNSARFSQCQNESQTREKIQSNIEEARALEIIGVPFVYLNDQEIMGKIKLEELKKITEAELGKSSNQ